MRILTPEEIAAQRAAYMHSLAMALIEGNVLYWRSATDEERDEVKAYLTRAGIKFPTERELAARERRGKEASAAKQAMEAKLTAKAKKTSLAGTSAETPKHES